MNNRVTHLEESLHNCSYMNSRELWPLLCTGTGMQFPQVIIPAWRFLFLQVLAWTGLRGPSAAYYMYKYEPDMHRKYQVLSQDAG